MNARTLASTLFGVAGIWMLAQLIATSSAVIDLYGRLASVTTIVGHLLAALVLLLGRDRFARMLFPDEELEMPTATVLLDVGLRLAGVMVIAQGIDRLAWDFSSRKAAVMSVDFVSTLPQALALLVFGLGLVIGARPLAALLGHARSAGRQGF